MSQSTKSWNVVKQQMHDKLHQEKQKKLDDEKKRLESMTKDSMESVQKCLDGFYDSNGFYICKTVIPHIWESDFNAYRRPEKNDYKKFCNYIREELQKREPNAIIGGHFSYGQDLCITNMGESRFRYWTERIKRTGKPYLF